MADTLTIVLHGPHESAGGGVLAFCEALESGLSSLAAGERPRVMRLNAGAGRGDRTTPGGALAGAWALAASLPAAWRLARPGHVFHLNTSFTQKALVRDALLFLVARSRGCPTVVQFHGGAPADAPDPLSHWATASLCRADRIVVLNGRQQRELEARFPGIARKTSRLPNSVVLPPPADAARAEPRLANPRLLFLGRLDPRKGILECVRALVVMRQHGLTPPLEVAGDGQTLAEAEALAGQLGLGDQVTFHGRVSGKAKDELLRESSLLLLPTYYPEGQPIAVLEAYAWGLPVVACDLEPVSELVRDRVNGRLVPPRDPAALAGAVLSLLADEALYRACSETNRRLAETEFDSRRNAARFLDLYRTVASA
jgi:glycosyltransferase involved in cell wall biosynthesis